MPIPVIIYYLFFAGAGTFVLSDAQLPADSILQPAISIAEQARITVDPGFADRLAEKKMVLISTANSEALKSKYRAELGVLKPKVSSKIKDAVNDCTSNAACVVPTPTPKPFASVNHN